MFPRIDLGPQGGHWVLLNHNKLSPLAYLVLYAVGAWWVAELLYQDFFFNYNHVSQSPKFLSISTHRCFFSQPVPMNQNVFSFFKYTD